MQNQTIHEISSKSDNGKVVNFRGNIREYTDAVTDVTKPQWPILRLCNFFSKRNFDTGVGISFVGIPEISPYTKSEQPRIAGKHLTRHAGKHSTRHAKNGYSDVVKQHPLRSRASLFLRVGDRCHGRQIQNNYFQNILNHYFQNIFCHYF